MCLIQTRRLASEALNGKRPEFLLACESASRRPPATTPFECGIVSDSYNNKRGSEQQHTRGRSSARTRIRSNTACLKGSGPLIRRIGEIPAARRVVAGGRRPCFPRLYLRRRISLWRSTHRVFRVPSCSCGTTWGSGAGINRKPRS